MNSFNKNDLIADDDECAMELRYNAQAPFVKCNKLLLSDYIDVSPRAKLLYLTLKSFVYEQKYRQYQQNKKLAREEVAWPGRKLLATMMGCTTKTVSNLLAELRKYELITSERRSVGQTWVHRLCVLKKQRSKL